MAPSPLPDPGTGLDTFHGLLTTAPEMHALFRRIERAARSDAPVLIRGATGTGKELVARALHDVSSRSPKPFRAVNCATFSPELLASELFGHIRGAFTGAVKDRPGLFQIADGGTVFLDEIAEMAVEVQARLLRVLQEQSFVPVGGSAPVQVDVRLISATHEALRERVDAGLFRRDLMYRVRVVVLYLPALRERTGDVAALTWHFIRTFNQDGLRRITHIAPDAWEAMQSYPWPGNVRELRNNLEQAYALGEGPVLQLDDLAPELQEPWDGGGAAPVDPSRPQQTWSDVERSRILDALAAAGGRRQEAADALGMSRSTLWRKMREHAIT